MHNSIAKIRQYGDPGKLFDTDYKSFVFHSACVQATRELKSGVLLSLLIHIARTEGSLTIYRTNESLRKTLLISPSEFGSAVMRLVEQGLIEITGKGTPSKTRYTLKLPDHLEKLLMN